MALPMPIPPKPPWYSTPTAIEFLPTAAPNCNSLIESPTDTPTTENCKNTSYKNNNNDRPDDDDDDVDCFPRQDKQPVIQQQDISPTDTLPSLIESPTDKPTTTTETDKTKNDNNDDDDDCFSRQEQQPRSSFSLPAITHNPTQAPHKPQPKRTGTKQSAHRGYGPQLVKGTKSICWSD